MTSGRIPLLTLCLAVPALAACGGAGGSTPTKAQYASKLSRLCLVAADRVRELHLDNTVAAWKADGPRLIRIEERFDARLAALKAPGSIAAAVADYTKANAVARRDTKAAVAAARAGDAAALHAAIRRSNRDNRATWPAARLIGATGCYIG